MECVQLNSFSKTKHCLFLKVPEGSGVVLAESKDSTCTGQRWPTEWSATMPYLSHCPGYDTRKSTTWKSTPHLWPNMRKRVFVCTHLWIWGRPGREADTALRQMEDGRPQITKSVNTNGQYVNLKGLIRTRGLIMIDRSKAQLPACPHQPDVWLV